jgi:hypothetical protein
VLGKHEPFFERFFYVISRANELNHKSSIADQARKKMDFFIENRMDPDTLKLLKAAHDAVDEAKLVSAMEVCTDQAMNGAGWG